MNAKTGVPAMKIEEARQEVAGHLVEHIRNGTHPQEKCCMPVADAYALAVLEELPVNPEHPHDKELREAILRLRRRIGELGK